MSISIALSTTSPIANYSDLLAKLGVFLDRDDLALELPTYIQLAEMDMSRELRTPEMEHTITFTASAEDTTLNSDFQAMRAIYIEDSPDRPLRAMSPTTLKMQFDGSVGVPVAYSLVSGGIRLAPPPATAVSLTMDYFTTLEQLSVANPSNWILEKHPALYIHGPLYYAYMALDNAERASQHKGLFDLLLAKVNQQARNNRFGAGPLVPNTTAQVWQARA